MATPPTVDCSAVVVNHNAGDALLACVDSVRAAGCAEVIVVDNASADGSFVRLAGHDTAACLVPAGANLGYGRGANLGAARASGEYLLVCNPDLVLDPATPRRLVEYLAGHPDVGAVGPLVLDPGGQRAPSARAFPGIADAIGHAVIGLFRPDNPFTRRYQLADHELTEPTAVDWVSGACMMLRRVAFESVGGFDPAYFMYVEDLDLCWRLHRAGWEVAYVPDVSVTHTGGLSTRRHPYVALAAHHRSTFRFYARSARGAERLLLPAVGAALAARFLAAAALEARRSRAGGRA